MSEYVNLSARSLKKIRQFCRENPNALLCIQYLEICTEAGAGPVQQIGSWIGSRDKLGRLILKAIKAGRTEPRPHRTITIRVDHTLD